MIRVDYFRLCLKEQVFINRAWILNTFAVPYEDREPKFTYDIGKRGDSYFFRTRDGGEEPIDDNPAPKQPLFPAGEPITLKPGDLPNITVPEKTVYAQAMVNAIVFAWPLGDKVPFIATAPIDNGRITKETQGKYQEGLISVDEYTNIHKAMDFLEVFSRILVSTLTEASMRPFPEVLELRDRLLKQYDGQLHKPEVAALVDDALYKLDMELMKNDPVMRFFIKKKSFQTVRKKLYTAQGGVPRLDDPTKVMYIGRSLAEGTRPEDLPFANNASRSGSYDRGASTAFGGAGANNAARAGDGISIKTEYCGTKAGLEWLVLPSNIKDLNGRYLVGTDKPLTPESASKYMGKVVHIHGPIGCNVEAPGLCARCMGDVVAKSGVGIGAQFTEIQSVYLSIFLAAFHAKVLTLVKYDYSANIS